MKLPACDRRIRDELPCNIDYLEERRLGGFVSLRVEHPRRALVELHGESPLIMEEWKVINLRIAASNHTTEQALLSMKK
jgi:hypothetical protein